MKIPPNEFIRLTFYALLLKTRPTNRGSGSKDLLIYAFENPKLPPKKRVATSYPDFVFVFVYSN